MIHVQLIIQIIQVFFSRLFPSHFFSPISKFFHSYLKWFIYIYFRDTASLGIHFSTAVFSPTPSTNFHSLLNRLINSAEWLWLFVRSLNSDDSQTTTFSTPKFPGAVSLPRVKSEAASLRPSSSAKPIWNRKIENYFRFDYPSVRQTTSYSLLVKNFIKTCFRYLKFTSSSLGLLWRGVVTVFVELGFITAVSSASLSKDVEGILSSLWSVFFMSLRRCWRTFIVCNEIATLNDQSRTNRTIFHLSFLIQLSLQVRQASFKDPLISLRLFFVVFYGLKLLDSSRSLR